jgi:beta-glucosidase
MVPYSSIGISDTTDPWLTKENQMAAREVTQRTIVLLKNSKNLLPLDKGKIKSIAVIGPHADEVLLDWYSGTPPYTISPLAGIKNKVGDAVEVRYAKDNTGDAAVTLAKTADLAIVCVGNHPTCDGAPFGECPTPSDGREAVDRQVIILEQEELIKEVYSANPNTIVVLVSSFPYAINWTQENVPAILHMTHASQEMGNALADVLFGDYNPGGRLVQTWPKSMDQLPPMMEYDIRNGHTYMYFKGEPLYPFGYGLSYTTFGYSNLEVSSNKLKTDGEITVRVTIQNSGNRTGDEVVQLYVKHLNSTIDRPLKEIKGFRRVTLKPNESKTVEIPLKAETLACWDVNKHRFVVEEDKIQVMVGASSSDIKLQEIIKVVH